MIILPTFFLQRTSDTGKETFGVLFDQRNNRMCFTIERPWLDNQPQLSCIPAGTYLFYRFQSPHNGDVWRTDSVPGRTAIEIHSANFASQLEGCIAVGSSIGAIDNVPAVLDSKATLAELHTKLSDKFSLTITGAIS